MRAGSAAGKPAIRHHDQAATHGRLVLQLPAELEKAHVGNRAGQQR
jgi:hypothetical protein